MCWSGLSTVLQGKLGCPKKGYPMIGGAEKRNKCVRNKEEITK